MTAAAKLSDSAPVFAVTRATMQPMIGFFVDQLGFAADTLLSEPVQFAMLKRDGKTVMLTCVKPFEPPQSEWAVYFWVDDVAAMHTEVVARGGKPGALTDKPYDMAEFEIAAPDGRIITFGQ
jgi:predicted enzyme related to lactoylglutathione lyase